MIRGEFFIPGRLPGLNELIGEANKNRHAYNKLKKSCQEKVTLCARGLPQFPGSVRIWYEFHEIKNHGKLRDPSNIVAGAIKLIEDALVGQGVLIEDTWSVVKGFHPTWREVTENPGIRVTILGEESKGAGLSDSADDAAN